MIADRRDFEFFFRLFGLDALLERERFSSHDQEDVLAILSLAERISETELASHLRQGDMNEPYMRPDGGVTVLPAVAHAVRVIAEAGLFATVFDAEYGGLQLPYLVYIAALGILMSGNLATASFLLLTVGNARLLTTYANQAQVAAFAEPQIAGATMGTMCLSEPHAGSSLGDIRTRATPDGDDALGARYRISGAKMWISGGDHNITKNINHLVLAKVPHSNGQLPEGTGSISLFIVPKILPDGQDNDVTVAGLNHKLGYRAIPNTALNFGEGKFTPNGGPGAVGWMVGQPGQGLRQMFQMMNEARVSVGLAGAMLAYRGYLMSLDYARQRVQGRAAGSKGGPQIPIIEHPDVRRMLLAQRAISQGALGLVLFAARLLDEEKTASVEKDRSQAASLLALLTPVVKTWPSEWAQWSLHDALQIHGGAGYTRDFEIEQLFRDNRLNPIHEGTTGIQGLDLLGRKIRRDKGAAFGHLVERIRASIGGVADGSALAASSQSLELALAQVKRAVEGLLAEPDDASAFAHGTPFLFAFGHLVVGWLWLDQGIAAAEMLAKHDPSFDQSFLNGRIRTCRYFAETELPRVSAWLAPVLAGSDLVLTAPIDEF